MKFFAKHKGATAAAAVILLVLALAVSSFFTKGRVSPVSSAINTVFQPLHMLVGSVTDYFVNLADAARQNDILRAENERLRVFIADMQENMRQSEELQEENDWLRTALGLDLRERGFTVTSATVMQRNVSEWERTLMLSKGSEAGIEVGQCVITSENYLVGSISEVGNGWATVKTIVDTGFSVGAKVERTVQTAVAEGNWALMRSNRLRLVYLELGSDIIYGDLVQTSGLGRVFPPGIPVGTVVSVQTDASGQTEYAELEPLADFDALTRVLIVTDYTFTE